MAGKDACAVLKKFMADNKLSAEKFFEKLDKGGKKSIDYATFKAGLKENKVDLTDDQIDKLIEYVDIDNDKAIDFSEFKQQIEK